MQSRFTLTKIRCIAFRPDSLQFSLESSSARDRFASPPVDSATGIPLPKLVERKVRQQNLAGRGGVRWRTVTCSQRSTDSAASFCTVQEDDLRSFEHDQMHRLARVMRE